VAAVDLRIGELTVEQRDGIARRFRKAYRSSGIP